MRPYRIDEQFLDELVAKFRHSVSTLVKPTEREVSFKHEINQKTPNAIQIRFTSDAYTKMMALVRHFSTEIAWHGLVKRHDKTHFEIYDIEVYPQVVTGATVDTDQAKYQMWLMDEERHPDERFNDIRMQGHSHVNMSVSPSATDIQNQNRTLDVLNGNDFYIFMIWNKREEYSCRVYDLPNNVVYDQGDVELVIEDELESFLDEAEEMLETPKPTYTQGFGRSDGYGSYGYYGGNYQQKGGYQGATGGASSYGAGNGYGFVQQTGAGGAKKEEKAPVTQAVSQGFSLLDDEEEDTDQFGLYDYYKNNKTALASYGNSSCKPYEQ